MSWLMEAYLEEADNSVRKDIIKEIEQTILLFFSKNDIKLHATGLARNKKFKKGETNEIVICCGAPEHTPESWAKVLLFGWLYIMPVLMRDVPKVKELLDDPKKKEELNKMLKNNCKSGTVTVKSFNPSNQNITLAFKDSK